MEQCSRSTVRFKAVYLIKGVADRLLGKDSRGRDTATAHLSSTLMFLFLNKRQQVKDPM